jgi:NAD(P)-dependent dehydrogenase (short-subunit alcohol dehydrogenase family)
MIKQKSGKIVNITSGAAYNGGMFTSGYATAKAGVISLTMAVAKDAGPDGINVNCVSPGPANTGFAKNAPPGMLENFPKTLPIRRLTTTQDVANAVTFLVSDAASDIVGQVLIVSGGVSP